MIKNVQPFGENVRKPQGGGILTHNIYPYLTLPLGRMSPVDDIQRSDHQVGLLRFPDKPEAREISLASFSSKGQCVLPKLV